MQIRALVLAASFGILASTSAAAQDRGSGDPMASGLVAGDYLRIGGGATMPVNPQGSLKNWGTGPGFSIEYENWQSGDMGVGRVGFGITGAYSMLPLKSETFSSSFTPITGGTTTSATASSAKILEITSNVRIRFPAPILMPAVTIGFGFINWAPGTINYVSTTGSGSVKQSHRSGAELSIGGSLDRQLWDRYALYAEAAYVYGYTSYGQGFATPGGVCGNNNCDVLKNTTIANIRGGLRIRMGN